MRNSENIGDIILGTVIHSDTLWYIMFNKVFQECSRMDQVKFVKDSL